MQYRKRPLQRTLPLSVGAAILIAGLLAAGCAGPGAGTGIQGTDWTLTGYVLNGTAVPALPGTAVTLVFGEDGRITGGAGCNRYFASYEVTATTITIGQAGSTLMYCDTPGVMEQESTYLRLLTRATTFTREGDRLSISDANGRGILSFGKTLPLSPEPLPGTPWLLESLTTGNAASPVLAGTNVSILFGRDGQVTGTGGCNRYFARYTLNGSSLAISTIGSTKMSCGTPGVMNQETSYLNLLARVQAYRFEGDQLALLDERGGRILTFTGGS